MTSPQFIFIIHGDQKGLVVHLPAYGHLSRGRDPCVLVLPSALVPLTPPTQEKHLCRAGRLRNLGINVNQLGNSPSFLTTSLSSSCPWLCFSTGPTQSQDPLEVRPSGISIWFQGDLWPPHILLALTKGQSCNNRLEAPTSHLLLLPYRPLLLSFHSYCPRHGH